MLVGTGRGTHAPRAARCGIGSRAGVEEDRGDVDAADAVDERVVGLGDDREAVVGQPWTSKISRCGRSCSSRALADGPLCDPLQDSTTRWSTGSAASTSSGASSTPRASRCSTASARGRRGSRRPLPTSTVAAGRGALWERTTVPARGPWRGLRSLTRAPRQGRRSASPAAWAGLGSMARAGLRPNPRSPLNVPIGPHRRYTWLPMRDLCCASKRSRRRWAARSTTSC